MPGRVRAGSVNPFWRTSIPNPNGAGLCRPAIIAGDIAFNFKDSNLGQAPEASSGRGDQDLT
jgi:hypothetical protein